MTSRTFVIRPDGRIDLVPPNFTDRLASGPFETVSYTRRKPCSVWTAHAGSPELSKFGLRIDVSMRHPRHGAGWVLAPSSTILRPLLVARREALEAHRSGGDLSDALWAEFSRFCRVYRAELVGSYKEYRPMWLSIMAQPKVVLHCPCRSPRWCHRAMLGRVLAKLGAKYEGEVDPR